VVVAVDAILLNKLPGCFVVDVDEKREFEVLVVVVAVAVVSFA
jgi:hypothetical protein